jgi:hypothetical protein
MRAPGRATDAGGRLPVLPRLRGLRRIIKAQTRRLLRLLFLRRQEMSAHAGGGVLLLVAAEQTGDDARVQMWRTKSAVRQFCHQVPHGFEAMRQFCRRKKRGTEIEADGVYGNHGARVMGLWGSFFVRAEKSS